MKNSQSKKALKRAGLITLCLVFLFNPYIKTFDLLPDFVAYFILMRLLTDMAYKAPYFEELRGSLKALGIVSIGRFSSMLILSLFRQSGSRIDDTVTLFVLVIAAVEIYFACGAVNNFFNAIGFLSERTSAGALYLPFSVNKKRLMHPNELKSLSYIFIVIKGLGNFLPEMLLLYQDPLSGRLHPRVFYPYVFLAAFIAVIIFGAVWLKACRGYLKHISSEIEGICAGIDELLTEEKLAKIEIKRTLHGKKLALLCLTVAAFLNFEVTLTEFREVNLLPTVIFAALSSYGFFALVNDRKKYRMMHIASPIFIGAASLKLVMQTAFLVSYEYSDLLSSGAANTAYKTVIVAAALELAALIFYLAVFAYSMCKYTDGTTRSEGLDAPDRTELERRRSYRIKAVVFSSIGILVGALKFIQVLINSTVNYEYVSTSDTTLSTVFYSDAPWFSLIIGLAVIVFGFYAVHYFGAIKDDEMLKYSEELQN